MSDKAKAMDDLIKDIPPDGDVNIYLEHDPLELDGAGSYAFRHVMRMTKEDLHSKADIAIQLGARDKKIDELIKALEAGQWTKCKDRLPDVDQKVLATYYPYNSRDNGMQVHIVTHDADGNFYYEDMSIAYYPEYWCAIPQPPKHKEGE